MARKNSSQKRCICIVVSVAVVVAVILAIVVPLAIILPRRKHAAATTILLPLYIYPQTNTTWSPLYTAIEARSHQNFTVIINPNSGPGTSKSPNERYSTELRKLNSYANVNTIGYVRTGYASRNISDVISEVDTYAGWFQESTDLAIHGIFFDEAPHVFSDSAVAFMESVDKAVKNSTGLQGQKLIVHNPGTIPDSRYNDAIADVTVILEDSYTSYLNLAPTLAASPVNRTSYAMMINSAPTMSSGNFKNFLSDLGRVAEFLFVTDNTQDYYESFGNQWATFTADVPI